MDLWTLYEKFKAIDSKVRDWLAGPGADSLDRFAEIGQDVIDASKQLRDYLRTLGDGATIVALSTKEQQALSGIREVKAGWDELLARPEAAALPPGLQDLILLVVSELVRKLLERWGG